MPPAELCSARQTNNAGALLSCSPHSDPANWTLPVLPKTPISSQGHVLHNWKVGALIVSFQSVFMSEFKGILLLVLESSTELQGLVNEKYNHVRSVKYFYPEPTSQIVMMQNVSFFQSSLYQ